jgi:phytoene desaturase
MSTAIVVGAGFGGLSAAAHLRAAGFDVTVIERASHPGGKADRRVERGYVFDTGPTLLTMPDEIDRAFRAVGSTLAAETELTRLEPVARYLFASGHELVVHADHERTKADIARFSPRDAAAWDGFFAECKEIWEVAGEPYLSAPFDGLVGYAQRALRGGSRALKMSVALGTLDELARRWFESPEMRMFVGRFATYAGGDPARSTGAFGMIPYLEIEHGAFYPRGGIQALAEKLRRALERAGVAFRFDTAVRQVLLDASGRATGVATAAGVLSADVVVVNADPLVAARALFPEHAGAARFATSLAQREPSLSGVAFGFGVEGDVPAHAHHNVLFPADYEAEFAAIFERRALPDDPTIYVSIPSHGDPTRAPAGHHVLFCLVNAPADEAISESAIARLRAHVLRELDRRFAPGITERIRAEITVTPKDIARTAAAGGAIYGAAPHGATSTFERPKHRAEFARGVYFVSGATHPGGGVPMVMKGGRFVAETVARDVRPVATSGGSFGALRRWFK